MDSNVRRIDKELGLFIYYCYNNTGMTIEELADALFVTPRTVQYYFTGQRKPSQRTLLRLVKVANVNCEDIPF